MIGVLLLFAQIGGVQFGTHVVPDTVYVGQQVTYDAVTLVNDATRARMRANPEYTPSEVTGVTIYDFPFDTASISDVALNGARFRRYVYRRALFPLSAGVYQIPPATLRYRVPEADAYLGQSGPTVLRSTPDTFVAVALPPSGRPLAFAGAVGELRDTIWTDGAAARVGDTFTVTVSVSGIGNLNLLPRPPLQVDWATIVPGDERVSWDSTGSAVRGSKQFDWVVTPRVAGDLSIPPVRYDFFNPATRRYEVATTALLSVPVSAAGGSVGAPVPPVRDTIGDSPFPMLMRMARNNALVIAIIGAVVILLIAVTFTVSGRRSSDQDDE
ncbi:MAG: BatD family protein [Gemmatimonadaceae bacterium]